MSVVRSSRPSRRVLSSLAGFALALAAPAAISQQPFDVLVSLVAPDQLGGEPVGDGELVVHRAAGTSRLAWPSETLSLLAGEGASGTHHVFGDIDAVHDEGADLAGDGLYISLVSDEAGFRDGDVLRPGADGFEVFLAEDAFVAATGATDGNVDVDAFHRDADGLVLFSFADVEASAFLSGDTPGVIGDGAVLSWMPPAGQAQIVHTEGAIDALVSAALGSSASTGDTKGLARDPVSGAVLFAVQAPSAHDGSIFSVENGGTVVAGHAEADFGFAGDVEVDALSVVSRRWPGMTTSSARPAPGETFGLSVHADQPGVPHAVLLALARGPSLLDTAGWGGLVLTFDALLDASIGNLAAQTLVVNGAGQATLDITLPLTIGPLDVVVQAVPLVAPPITSNPIVVEIAQ